MTAKWKDVRRSLSPERETRLQSRLQTELKQLPLAEVRRARTMTQTRLAELLQVNQAAVSKMEQRSDMYLSTLRSYVEAMGGCLEIRVVFPEGEVLLDHLGSELQSPHATRHPPAKRSERRLRRAG